MKANDLLKKLELNIIQSLQKKNLRITKPRKAILCILRQNHGPFSAEEIHQKLENTSNCDLATVYRCLKKFTDKDLIKKCHFGDGCIRYEYKELSTHHHHHILCRQCQRIEPIEYCFLAEMERMLTDKGYKNVEHSLEFFGVCQDCQKKQ